MCLKCRVCVPIVLQCSQTTKKYECCAYLLGIIQQHCSLFQALPLQVIKPCLSKTIIDAKIDTIQRAHFGFQYFLAISLPSRCHLSDWLWQHCPNNSLLWLGTPCLLLLSQCLWGLATPHWRSYMTVKRAINAGREAEVYGCFSLP